MTAEEAYAHAQATFGADAGVWSPGFGRCIVGRWLPLLEAVEARIGAYTTPARMVLRAKSKGLLVLGEGKDWSSAFMAAEARRKEIVR